MPKDLGVIDNLVQEGGISENRIVDFGKFFFITKLRKEVLVCFW